MDAAGAGKIPSTGGLTESAGEESAGQMANRGAFAVAERLGSKPVIFPSHHGGFMGGEFGWPGKPDEFAAKLREVLDGDAS